VAASAVDLATGPEQVVVHRCSDGVQMRGVERDEFEFITALDTGATLGRAVEHAALALERLPGLLRWMFTDGAVSSVTASAPGTSAAR
jgi:hypothetical protein